MKKKSFGQHFLHDQGVIKKIVDTVDLSAPSMVEIGPGGGALTHALIKRFPEDHLTLIEADRDLIPELREMFPKAHLVEGDAAKVAIPFTDWVLVANLPYNAAAAILRHVYARENAPRQAVVMVQKEQADRMRAKPGDMSLLSVFVQLYARVRKVFDVGAGAFTPPPNVVSTVLEFTKLPGMWEENEQILALAKAGFASRRKQLHKNLAELGVADSARVKAVLRQIGLPETARAQELSIEQWRQFQKMLSS